MWLVALFCAFAPVLEAHYGIPTNPPPLIPFPACVATDLNCLRRGLRTFFFLMDERHLGMTPVDPSEVTSLALAYPDIGTRFIMRNINITGAKWTDLVDRRMNDPAEGSNTIVFKNDFHVTSSIVIKLPARAEVYRTRIVMDIRDISSNVSYPWLIRQKLDDEHYVSIGPEEITSSKPRQITFYLEVDKDEPLLRNALENRPSILENIATEIAAAVMQNVIDNFRNFAHQVPLRFYYKF